MLNSTIQLKVVPKRSLKRSPEEKKAYMKAYYLKHRQETLEYKKKHYSNNKEKYITRVKEWTKNNPESRTRNWLKSTYSISLEEYNKMFNDQQGCCKICSIHQSESSRVLCIDHCHKTNKVRGLLCHKCNSALGFVNEKVSVLEGMIKYITSNIE